MNFGPAISKDARKEFSRRIRRLEITRRTRPSIEELAKDFNKIIRGYVNYFGLYSRKSMYGVPRNIAKEIRSLFEKLKADGDELVENFREFNFSRFPKGEAE